MNIKVDRNQLLNELYHLQGVALTKPTIQVLSHMSIEAIFGKIRMRATDLDLTITTECPADIREQGAICLPARKLIDIIKSLPQGEIEIKADKSFHATITCASSRFKLNGADTDNFPELEEYSGPFAEVPAEVFSRFIHRVIHAAAREESRYALNGAKLEISKERIRMVATDGHRLALIEREGDFGEQIEAIIPRKTLAELAKLCAAGEEAMRIGMTENRIHFKQGPRAMVSRLVAGNFPNYSTILPADNHRRFTVGREAILAAIKRVAIMADERQRAIKLEICDGEMRISSGSSEIGEAGETLAVDYSDEAITTGFNAVYLSDFFTAIEEDELTFEFKNGQSAAQLSCAQSSQDRCIGVIMPLRL